MSERKCVLSPCNQHRYYLKIPTGAEGRKAVVFYMCNPSTADHKVDDPTTKACIAFAKLWGYAYIEIVNLYSYRTPSPELLKSKGFPTHLISNAEYVYSVCRPGKLVICAWGTKVEKHVAEEQARKLTALGCELKCLGVSMDGHPKHPLYVKRTTPLIPYTL